jgi:hypothetical protein
MRKNEIKVGGHYRAKVSDKIVTVRVDAIREDGMHLKAGGRSTISGTRYDVTNLSTGRKTTFRSAVKFRSPVIQRTETRDFIELRGKVEPVLPPTDVVPVTAMTRPVDHRIDETGDCSCGQDGVTCQGCGKRICGTTATWVQRTGNKCPKCMEGKEGSDPTIPPSSPGTPGAVLEQIGTLPPRPNQTGSGSSSTPGRCDATAPTARPTGLAARIAGSRPPTDLAPHVIVEARAGTGKTTTLVEGLRRLLGTPTPGFVPSPQQQAVFDAIGESRGKVRNVCFLAFNKSIADELKDRVPPGVKAQTIHKLGLIAVVKVFRLQEEHGVNANRVGNIIGGILGKPIKDVRKEKPAVVRAVEDLVGLCKQTLVGYDPTLPKPGPAFDPGKVTPDVLYALASRYEIDAEGSWEDVVDLVPRVLDRCLDVSKDSCIDHDDMVWIPLVLRLPLYRFDLLLIDEAQDLNRSQQELVKGSGNRLIFCGDPRQAIYGFAGADSESMPRLHRDLAGDTAKYGRDGFDRGCIKLPLTVTRRCGRAIVKEANRIVKDFSAHESNPDGSVQTMSYPTQPGKARGETIEIPIEKTYLPHVKDGDMIICRSNAPLVRQCFKFLKEGRRARIQGRKIGDDLVSLVKRMDAGSIPELIERLGKWLLHEVAKEQAKPTPDESKIDRLTDRHDAAMVFAESSTSVDDVVRRIDAVFVNDPNVATAPILLSSVHRAKGLEARRVFFLRPAVQPVRFRMPDWQREQESNLEYVGITRAIEELIYVV